ncbi:MAG: peptidase dimerization domain-containing protein [Spirochaetaceae bacterium]|nr:MAG: peptidase dimerization domain-containing protein [Spirochaetaceae bacterium]
MADVKSEQENRIAPNFEEILTLLPFVREAGQAAREILLANLVMIGEIPSPTFDEFRRVEFIQNRFVEAGLHNASADEMGNALGILPGTSGEQNILVVAHVDTVHAATVDHTITLHPQSAMGPGVGDNALGVAVVVTLPTLLELLNIELESNLVLMGASRSLGRGDLEGLRFFLSNSEIPISVGIGIEGFPLGRLSYSSIGMYRGEIVCSVPEEYDWTRFGASGAIVTINEVINHIQEIRLPRRPRSTIVLGSILGGQAYNTIATNAVLRFEIRTESEEIGEEIFHQMEAIISEVSSQTGADITLDVFARRRPGGITYQHPLARAVRRIMSALDIQPRKSPSTAELSAFIGHDIPAITVGVTYGEHLNTPEEEVLIEPMFTGLAQLIGILLAIDRGFCNAD